MQFIDKNHKSWKHINVYEKAEKYFDFSRSLTVKYEGYLVNHSKKLVIDLKDYYEKSVSLTKDGEEYAIDLIPPLTETGDSTLMALFDGCSADVTEELIGSWCGDLLQILDELPDGHKKIDCCFASVWDRAEYCFKKFGLNDNQFILKNANGAKYEATALSFYLKRGDICCIQVEQQDGKLKFKGVYDAD